MLLYLLESRPSVGGFRGADEKGGPITTTSTTRISEKKVLVGGIYLGPTLKEC